MTKRLLIKIKASSGAEKKTHILLHLKRKKNTAVKIRVLDMMHIIHRDSTAISGAGLGMGLSSDPAPLSALLRPVREKW